MAVDRELTADVQTALTATPVRPIFFFEGEIDNAGATDYLRYFTGLGSLSWDSKTWLGGGNLLNISPWRETTGLEAVGFSVTISGLPTASLAAALQSFRRNAVGKLWLGFLSAAGAVVADPYLARRGRFERCPIRRNSGTLTIELQYRDLYADLDRPRERRYTPQDQRLRLDTDTGFDQVYQLQDSLEMPGSGAGSLFIGGAGGGRGFVRTQSK